MTVSQSAFFLPVDGGECFCVHRERAGGDVAAVVLHLPAFGDEMNKSRAMTARAARAFAESGYATLQIDLLGCGDSTGQHEAGSLVRWTANAAAALSWLRDRHGDIGVWLWSLRAGTLLIPPLLSNVAADTPLLLWQPVTSGIRQLNLLLRQHAAVDMLGTHSAGGTRALRERLRAGETLEIAGYGVSPELACQLEQAEFDLSVDYRGRIVWLEVTASAPPSLAPASLEKVERLRQRNVRVTAEAVQGATFWQSTEIELAESLIAASLASFIAHAPDALPRVGAVL